MKTGTFSLTPGEVVFYRSPQMNRPGAMWRGVLSSAAISCKVRARGRYIIGREEMEVNGPFLNLGAVGELDGNGLHGPVEMYWCCFTCESLRAGPGPLLTLELHDTLVQRSHFRPLASSELKHTVALFRDLMQLSRDPLASAQLRATALLFELLALWAQPPLVRGEQRAVYVYKDLIEQHAHDPEVPLAKLAERVGYSAAYLGALFQQELGVAPAEFRSRVRVARAKELLASSVMPIRQVAREAGFVDARYFSRAFRKSTGLSPREFLKRVPYGTHRTED